MSVGTYWAWETTATLRCARHQHPQREDRGGAYDGGRPLTVCYYLLCSVDIQTFLSAHELSLCLHSCPAVFEKCRRKSSTFAAVEDYSLIYGAFYQLLNSMLVHRAETVFRLVPVFVGAVKRILVRTVYLVCWW